MTRLLRPALVAASGALCASGARADGGPKIRDSLWLPLGLNAGYAINPDPLANGLLLGPEASFVYLDRGGLWGGVYVDALRDFGADVTRLSAGLEGGYAIFGLDAGWVGKTGEPFRNGYRVRGLLSFAAVHFYGGVGHFPSDGGATWGEVGVLLKFPIQLWEEPPTYPWLRYQPEPPQYPAEPQPAYPAPAPYPGSPSPSPPPFAQPPPP